MANILGPALPLSGGTAQIGCIRATAAHLKTIVLGNLTVLVRSNNGQIYPKGS